MENKQPHPLIKAVLDALSGGPQGQPQSMDDIYAAGLPTGVVPSAPTAAASPSAVDTTLVGGDPAMMARAGIKQAPGGFEALYGPQNGSRFASPEAVDPEHFSDMPEQPEDGEDDLPAAVKKARGSNGPK